MAAHASYEAKLVAVNTGGGELLTERLGGSRLLGWFARREVKATRGATRQEECITRLHAKGRSCIGIVKVYVVQMQCSVQCWSVREIASSSSSLNVRAASRT